MLLLSVLLFLSAADACLFPKECLPRDKYPTDCCPLYPPGTGSICGMNDGRGMCVSTSTSRADPDLYDDDRAGFPDFYFRTRCQCNNNFSGYNCGSCKLGFKGARCDQPNVMVHKDYREMSPTQQEHLKVQMNYCKDLMDPRYYMLQAGDRTRSDTFSFVNGSYYDVWVSNMHYSSQPVMWDGEMTNMNMISRSSAFLNSIKQAVLCLQEQMQSCLGDNTFAMPYDDWQTDSGCDLCTDYHLGASDQQGYLSLFNVFSSWRAVCADYDYGGTYCETSKSSCERTKLTRRAGMAPGITKPTTADIQRCINMTSLDTQPYSTSSRDSFRNCVEEMYWRWRQYMGGTMSEDALAYNDPMVPLAMVFIMKIQERWMSFQKIPPNFYPRDNPNYGHRYGDCCMPSFSCTLNGNMMVPLAQSNMYFTGFNGF